MLQCSPPVLARDQIIEVLARSWALEVRDLKPLPSERDHNVLVNGDRVLKVSNPAEQLGVLDMENASLAHIAQVATDLPVPRLVATREGGPTATLSDGRGRECRARLLTVVAGRPLEGAPISTATAEQVGALAARTSVALQGLFHPSAARSLDWDVRLAPTVLFGAGVLDGLGTAGPTLRALLDRMTAAAGATSSLPAGSSMPMSRSRTCSPTDGSVTGLIDFGDMHHTAASATLPSTLSSVLRNTADRAAARQLGARGRGRSLGYQRHRPLAPAEVDVLGDLVLARLGV